VFVFTNLYFGYSQNASPSRGSIDIFLMAEEEIVFLFT
jgi:hypothetical protein